MIDIIMSVIAVVLCAISADKSYSYWRKMSFKNRSFDYCIKDIRAMNAYNSYFLAAIIVFFGFAIDKGLTVLSRTSLVMLLLAFVFAAFAIFFFPSRRQTENQTIKGIKEVWLWTLIASQWTVILSACGIISIILPKLF